MTDLEFIPKIKARRENFNVSIRKKKNNNMMMSKRIKFMIQNDPDFGCIENIETDCSSNEPHLALLEALINSVLDCANNYKNGIDFLSLTMKMKQIRCLMSKDEVISDKIAMIFNKTDFFN